MNGVLQGYVNVVKLISTLTGIITYKYVLMPIKLIILGGRMKKISMDPSLYPLIETQKMTGT